MNTKNLKTLLQDLRKCDLIVTESELSSTISSIHTNEISTKIENFFEDKILRTSSSTKKKLTKLRSECEDNNKLAMKTITISRPDLIEDLIDYHLSSQEKIVKFLTKHYDDGQSLLDAYDSMMKHLDKVDDKCDEVFSFKDAYNMHTVISHYFDLLKKVTDVDEVTSLCNECLPHIHEYEDEIDEVMYLKKTENIGDNKELQKRSADCGIAKHKLKYFRQGLSKYADNTIRIYGKTYSMIRGLD